MGKKIFSILCSKFCLSKPKYSLVKLYSALKIFSCIWFVVLCFSLKLFINKTSKRVLIHVKFLFSHFYHLCYLIVCFKDSSLKLSVDKSLGCIFYQKLCKVAGGSTCVFQKI